MPYLSNLLNRKIRDSADKTVGRLEDVLISTRPSEYSPLEYLAVKKRMAGQKLIFIPYSAVENFSSSEISLKSPIEKINVGLDNPENGWVYLKQDVLDEQIVDVQGARVVRVNDLRLGAFQDRMSVVGVDISTKGLLRRLGIAGLDVFDIFKVHLIDWRHTQPVRGTLKLDTIGKNLNKLHPADLANIVEELNLKFGSNIVSSLDERAAAKVLEEVNPRLQKILVKYLGPERAVRILEQMPTDEIVDLLKTMPKEEARAFLALLKNSRSGKIEKLIKYEDDTAGGLMTVDFIKMKSTWTVQEAIEEIKTRSPALRSILYTYVLDDDDCFLGAVSLRWLIISDAGTKLRELLKTFPMTSVLRPDQDIEDVMKVMTKYDLYTAVVLDDDNRMLGVVTIDDVMRHLVPKA